MTSDTKTPILTVDSVTKRYAAVQALRSVSMTLHAGEVVGLVGDNGAGKSTLVSVISGTTRADSGRILVDGVDGGLSSPSDARRLGIETVFQNLALIGGLSIADNVFLGRELRRPGLAGKLGWTDKRRMREDVESGFRRLGLSLPGVRTKSEALSGGQRQAVAIARAVLWGGHIVLMDEPNAALGVTQTEIVLSFVEQLKSHNVGVVFISHNMQQVLRVADRVVVMRLGQVSYEGPSADLTPAQLAMKVTGVG